MDRAADDGLKSFLRDEELMKGVNIYHVWNEDGNNVLFLKRLQINLDEETWGE
jgi:hypothetical protein